MKLQKFYLQDKDRFTNINLLPHFDQNINKKDKELSEKNDQTLQNLKNESLTTPFEQLSPYIEFGQEAYDDLRGKSMKHIEKLIKKSQKNITNQNQTYYEKKSKLCNNILYQQNKYLIQSPLEFDEGIQSTNDLELELGDPEENKLDIIEKPNINININNKLAQQFIQNLGFGKLPEIFDSLINLQKLNSEVQQRDEKLKIVKRLNEYITKYFESINQQGESIKTYEYMPFKNYKNVFNILSNNSSFTRRKDDNTVTQSIQSKDTQIIENINVAERVLQGQSQLYELSKEQQKFTIQTFKGKSFKQCQEIVQEMKESIMQKQNQNVGLSSQYLSTSIACDGTYLYIYQADTINGCMLKVGTGYNHTEKGKIYLEKNTNKQETQASWIYTRGKLLLKTIQEGKKQCHVMERVKDISKHGITIRKTPDFPGQKTEYVSEPGQLHGYSEKILKEVDYGTQKHKINCYKLKDGRGWIFDKDIPRNLDTLVEMSQSINKQIELINPNNFETEYLFQIESEIFDFDNCQLNKNYQLLCDQENLLVVGLYQHKQPQITLLSEDQIQLENTNQSQISKHDFRDQIVGEIEKQFEKEKTINTQEYREYLDARQQIQSVIDEISEKLQNKEFHCKQQKTHQKLQVLSYQKARDQGLRCNFCNNKYVHSKYQLYICAECSIYLCESCITSPANRDSVIEIKRNNREIQELKDKEQFLHTELRNNYKNIQQYEIDIIQQAILKEKLKNTYLYDCNLYKFPLDHIFSLYENSKKNNDKDNNIDNESVQHGSKVLLYQREEQLNQEQSRKNILSTLNKISYFKFTEQKNYHKNLTLTDSCTIKNGSYEGYKFGLMDPELVSSCEFAFKMLSGEFKWTAIGICECDKIKEQSFTISDFKQGHGLYLVINNGGTLSSNDADYNNRFMSPFQFKQGDIIICNFDAETNEISFKKESTGEKFKLKLKQARRTALKICVLFKGNNSDEIQYIEKLDYLNYYKDPQTQQKIRRKKIIDEIIQSSEQSFTKMFKHPDMKIIDKNTIKSEGPNGYKFAVLDKPLVEKTQFAFKMLEGTFKWVAIGICHLETIKEKKFIFDPHNIGHGAYMISQNAGTWSNIQSEFNNAVKAFKFGLGAIIVCDFDPDNKQITFFNEKNPKETYTLKIKIEPKNPLHICTVIHFSSDEIQFIEQTDQIPYYKEHYTYKWQYFQKSQQSQDQDNKKQKQDQQQEEIKDLIQNSNIFQNPSQFLQQQSQQSIGSNGGLKGGKWVDFSYWENQQLNESYQKGKKDCMLKTQTVDFKTMLAYTDKYQQHSAFQVRKIISEKSNNNNNINNSQQNQANNNQQQYQQQEIEEISNEAYDCIWTCSESKDNTIVQYNPQGTHIFSTSEKDVRKIPYDTCKSIYQKFSQKADIFLSKKIYQNIELKGTYIQTINKVKGYAIQPNFNVCFDSVKKEYYQLHPFQAKKFLPLVTVLQNPRQSYINLQLHQQQQQIQQNNNNQLLENSDNIFLDFQFQVLEQIRNIQKYKYYFYNWTREKQNEIIAGSSSIKNNNNSKEDLLENSYNNKILFIERYTQFLFSLDGSLKCLVSLYSSLETLFEKYLNDDFSQENQEIKHFIQQLQFLQYWFMDYEFSAVIDKKGSQILVDIEEFIYKIMVKFLQREHDQQFQIIQQNLLNILFIGNKALIRTNQQQFKWLQLFLENKEKLSLYFKNINSSIIQKEDNNENNNNEQQQQEDQDLIFFQQKMYNNYSESAIQFHDSFYSHFFTNFSLVEPIGRLLIENIDIFRQYQLQQKEDRNIKLQQKQEKLLEEAKEQEKYYQQQSSAQKRTDIYREKLKQLQKEKEIQKFDPYFLQHQKQQQLEARPKQIQPINFEYFAKENLFLEECEDLFYSINKQNKNQNQQEQLLIIQQEEEDVDDKGNLLVKHQNSSQNFKKMVQENCLESLNILKGVLKNNNNKNNNNVNQLQNIQGVWDLTESLVGEAWKELKKICSHEKFHKKIGQYYENLTQMHFSILSPCLDLMQQIIVQENPREYFLQNIQKFYIQNTPLNILQSILKQINLTCHIIFQHIDQFQDASIIDQVILNISRLQKIKKCLVIWQQIQTQIDPNNNDQNFNIDLYYEKIFQLINYTHDLLQNISFKMLKNQQWNYNTQNNIYDFEPFNGIDYFYNWKIFQNGLHSISEDYLKSQQKLELRQPAKSCNSLQNSWIIKYCLPHIQKYVTQIENGQGEFVEYANQFCQQQNHLMNTKDKKEILEGGQKAIHLLLLLIMYQSGLLQSELVKFEIKEYLEKTGVQQHILNSMVKFVQGHRILQEIQDERKRLQEEADTQLKNSNSNIITNNNEEIMQKLEQAFLNEDDFTKLELACNQLGLEYSSTDSYKQKKLLFQRCLQILEKKQIQSDVNLYQLTVQKIVEKSLFLLNFRNSFSSELQKKKDQKKKNQQNNTSNINNKQQKEFLKVQFNDNIENLEADNVLEDPDTLPIPNTKDNMQQSKSNCVGDEDYNNEDNDDGDNQQNKNDEDQLLPPLPIKKSHSTRQQSPSQVNQIRQQNSQQQSAEKLQQLRQSVVKAKEIIQNWDQEDNKSVLENNQPKEAKPISSILAFLGNQIVEPTQLLEQCENRLYWTNQLNKLLISSPLQQDNNNNQDSFLDNYRLFQNGLLNDKCYKQDGYTNIFFAQQELKDTLSEKLTQHFKQLTQNFISSLDFFENFLKESQQLSQQYSQKYFNQQQQSQIQLENLVSNSSLTELSNQLEQEQKNEERQKQINLELRELEYEQQLGQLIDVVNEVIFIISSQWLWQNQEFTDIAKSQLQKFIDKLFNLVFYIQSSSILSQSQLGKYYISSIYYFIFYINDQKLIQNETLSYLNNCLENEIYKKNNEILLEIDERDTSNSCIYNLFSNNKNQKNSYKAVLENGKITKLSMILTFLYDQFYKNIDSIKENEQQMMEKIVSNLLVIIKFSQIPSLIRLANKVFRAVILQIKSLQNIEIPQSNQKQNKIIFTTLQQKQQPQILQQFTNELGKILMNKDLNNIFVDDYIQKHLQTKHQPQNYSIAVKLKESLEKDSIYILLQIYYYWRILCPEKAEELHPIDFSQQSQNQLNSLNLLRQMPCGQCRGPLKKTDGPYILQGAGWICNLCNVTFLFNEQNMHCHTCTFDCCFPCFEEQNKEIAKNDVLKILKEKYKNLSEIDFNLDSQELQQKKQRENNFIILMQNLLYKVEQASLTLIENNLIVIEKNLTEYQAQQLAHLVNLASQQQLQKIQLDEFQLTDKQKKKLNPYSNLDDSQQQSQQQEKGESNSSDLKQESDRKSSNDEKKTDPNVLTLMEFGYSEKQVKYALIDAKNNLDIAANNLLMGFYDQIQDDEPPSRSSSSLNKKNSSSSIKIQDSDTQSQKGDEVQKILDIDIILLENDAVQFLLKSTSNNNNQNSQNNNSSSTNTSKYTQNYNKFQISGKGQSYIAQEYMEIIGYLVKNSEEFQEQFYKSLQDNLQEFKTLNNNSSNNYNYEFLGLIFSFSGFQNQLRKFQRVDIKDYLYNNDKKFYIYGYNDGFKSCDIISTKQKDIIFENIDIQLLEPKSRMKHRTQFSDDLLQLLLENIQIILEDKNNQQENNNNIILLSLLGILQTQKLKLNENNEKIVQKILERLIISQQKQNNLNKKEYIENPLENFLACWENLTTNQEHNHTITILKNLDFFKQEYSILNEYMVQEKKQPQNKENNNNNNTNDISEFSIREQVPINDINYQKVQSNFLTSLPSPQLPLENTNIEYWDRQKFIWRLFREEFDKVRLKNSIIYDDKVQIINILYEILNPKDQNPGKKSFFEKKQDVKTKLKHQYQDKDIAEKIYHIHEPQSQKFLKKEDLQIGQIYLIKSKRFSNANHIYFKMGSLKYIPVIVLWVEQSQVLIQYIDEENHFQTVQWVENRDSFIPSQQILPQYASQSYGQNYLQNQFNNSVNTLIQQYSRQILINYYSNQQQQNGLQIYREPQLQSDNNLSCSGKLLYNFENINIISSLVQWALKANYSDCIDSWQKCIQGEQIIPQDLQNQYNIHSQIAQSQENSISAFRDIFFTLNKFEDQEKSSQIFQQLLQQQQKQLSNIVEFMVSSSKFICLNDLPRTQNLNDFKPYENHSIKSVLLGFTQDSKINISTKINFYSDSENDNKVINRIHVGLDHPKTHLQPLQLKRTQIYCNLFFCDDQLPIYREDLIVKTVLDCQVYPIPDQWNQILWMLDTISSSLVSDQNCMKQWSLQLLSKLILYLIKLLLKLENVMGPIQIKQQVINLITRVSKKINILIYFLKSPIDNLKNNHNKIFGFSQENIDYFIKQIEEIKKQEEQQNILYSSYLQELIEMVASLATPLAQKINKEPFSYTHRDIIYKNQIPEYIENIINIQIIYKFIQNQGILSSQLYQQTVDSQSQWSNMVCLVNLPRDKNPKEIKDLIQKILEKSGRRLIDPRKDIIIPCQEFSSQNISQYLSNLSSTKAQQNLMPNQQQQQQQRHFSQQQQPGMQITHEGVCIIFTDGSIATESESKSLYQQEDKDIVEEMFSDESQCQNCNQLMKSKCHYCQDLIIQFSKYFPKSQIILGRNIMHNMQLNKYLQKILKQRLQDIPQQYHQLIQYLPFTNNNLKLNNSTIKALNKSYSYILECSELKQQLKRYIPELQLNTQESYVKSFENYVNTTNQSMIAFQVLSDLGFNLWLNESTFAYNEPPQLLPQDKLAKIMHNLQDLKYLYDNTQMDSKQLRFSRNLLRVLNKNLEKSFLLVNLKKGAQRFTNIFETQKSEEKISQQIFDLSLSNNLQRYKDLIIKSLKQDIVQQVLTKTAIKDLNGFTLNVPYVYIDKMKKIPQFIQAFQSLKDVQRDQLLPIKSNDKGVPFVAFEVITQTLAQGSGGQYRQFFNDISMELKNEIIGQQFNLVPLLILNNEKKEEYAINPKADTSFHLQLFEFLGVLMGCCIRTNTPLSINLPLIFWKQLVQQNISKEDWLQAKIKKQNDSSQETIFDEQIINYCISTAEDGDEIDFSYFDYHVQQINEYYQKLNQDKSSLINIPQQRQQQQQLILEQQQQLFQFKSAQNNLDEIIPRYCQALLSETSIQVQYIKKGLYSIIPEPLVKIISAKDLEILVSGVFSIDIDILMKNTVYQGQDQDGSQLSESSPRIQYLWKALKDEKYFNQEDRRKFVQYCYGVDRLPKTDEEFKSQGITFQIGVDTSKKALVDADNSFATVQTCFFLLKLPDYSSIEVLTRQIKASMVGAGNELQD